MEEKLQRGSSAAAKVAALLGTVLFAAAGLDSQPAFGQDSSAAAAPVLEEIIVTARKRQESLLEIPESVVAFSSDQIARQAVDNLRDIGIAIPNLNLSMRTDGFPNVTIRGIGGFGNTQGVGFYLDDVQVFSDASSRFGDLERIEVLKGPQGTLYGGSNIGGAVKFVSARPDPTETFGRVKGRFGEQSLVDMEAAANLPLGDSGWAMRAFGFFYQDDGFLVNENPPRLNGLRGDNDKDVGAVEEYGGRVTLSGPISDRLSAYAALRWNEMDGFSNVWMRELTDDFQYNRAVNNSTNSTHKRDTVAGTVELEWDLDQVSVLSLTSYTTTNSTRYTDADIREEFIFDANRPEDMDVFTQELRFTSTTEGPLSWIAGAYYSLFEERMRSTQIWWDARVDADGNISGPLGCAIGMPTCSGVWTGEILTPEQEMDFLAVPFEIRDRDKSHLAAFANVNYEWETWELDLGLRVDRWKNSTDNFDTGISSSQDDVEVLPRASLTKWLTDESMVYFTYAKGYEPGGYNLANFEGENNLFGFDIEEASSFEIGWKTRLLEDRLTLSAAAFYIDYTDRQVEFQAQTGGQVIEGIINLGDSEQYGFEAEMNLKATEHLTLTAALGVIDAEWNSGTLVDFGESSVDLSGTDVPNTNDTSWMLSALYNAPLPAANGMRVVAGVQVSHSGSLLGLQAWDTVKNPSYTVANAQVGLQGERWEVLVQVENFTDEEYYTDVQRFPNLHALDGGENINIGTMGQPRLVSATLNYRF